MNRKRLNSQDVVVSESRRRSAAVLYDARQILPDLVNVEQLAQFLVLGRRQAADARVQRQFRRRRRSLLNCNRRQVVHHRRQSVFTYIDDPVLST